VRSHSFLPTVAEKGAREGAAVVLEYRLPDKIPMQCMDSVGECCQHRGVSEQWPNSETNPRADTYLLLPSGTSRTENSSGHPGTEELPELLATRDATHPVEMYFPRGVDQRRSQTSLVDCRDIRPDTYVCTHSKVLSPAGNSKVAFASAAACRGCH
jgi:hypothetical protein